MTESKVNPQEIIERWKPNKRFNAMQGFIHQLLDVNSPHIPLLYSVRGSFNGVKSLNQLVEERVVSNLVFKLKHPQFDDPGNPQLTEVTDEKKWLGQSIEEFNTAMEVCVDDGTIVTKINQIVDALLSFGLNVIKEGVYNEIEVDTIQKIEEIYRRKPSAQDKSIAEEINELRA